MQENKCLKRARGLSLEFSRLYIAVNSLKNVRM